MSGKQRVVAALDFGTYGSGYAWTTVTRDNDDLVDRKIAHFFQWKDQRALNAKNRTAVLTGPDGASWCEAVSRSSRAVGMKLAVYEIGSKGELQDAEGHWDERMGVPPDGVVLVRPDSFVAWRGSRRAHTPERFAEEVLARIVHPTAPV